jgi:hypothetical protein
LCSTTCAARSAAVQYAHENFLVHCDLKPGNTAQGRLAVALAARRSAGDLLDRVVAASPGTYRYVVDQADNLCETGNILAALHNREGARECYRPGLDIAQKLASGDTTSQLLAELRASAAKLDSPPR